MRLVSNLWKDKMTSKIKQTTERNYEEHVIPVLDQFERWRKIKVGWHSGGILQLEKE